MGKILSAFIAALIFVQPAFPAVTNADRALVERGQNGMTNGGFESGKNGWVASAGPFTTTTSAGNVDSGTTSGSWTASGAAGRTLDYAMTITAGGAFSGQNGVASCKFKAASGTATHTISVVDGSGNNLGNVNPIISSTVSYVRTSSNFVFPSSGTVKLRITTVSASEPQLFVDTCYLGTADGYNLTSVGQAASLGKATFNVSSSVWALTSSSSYQSFAAVPAIGAPTLSTGATITGPATILPKVLLPSSGAGTYIVTGTGIINIAGTSGVYCSFFDSNGVGDTNGMYNGNPSSGNSSINVLRSTFVYSGPQTNQSFEIKCRSLTGLAQTISIGNASTGETYSIDVQYIPSSYQLAASVNQPIYPTVQKFTTTGAFTYTRPANVSYIQVKMVGAGGGGGGGGTGSGGSDGTAGGNTVFSNWTANGGTQGTKGNSTVGSGVGGAQPSFTVGTGSGNCWPGTAGNGGYYNVSASNFSFGGGGPSVFGGGPGSVTGNTAGRSGSANTGSGGAGGGGVGGATLGFGGGGSAGSYCEFTINAPAATISGSLGAGGAGGSAATSGAAGGSGGDGYIEVWEYYGSQSPILIGSVSSNSAGPERIERAYIANNGTCTISSQTGSWLSSVSRVSTGSCSLTISTGMFSATPVCICSNAIGANRGCNASTSSATAASFQTWTAGGAANTLADQDATIICMGPR